MAVFVNLGQDAPMSRIASARAFVEALNDVRRVKTRTKLELRIWERFMLVIALATFLSTCIFLALSYSQTHNPKGPTDLANYMSKIKLPRDRYNKLFNLMKTFNKGCTYPSCPSRIFEISLVLDKEEYAKLANLNVTIEGDFGTPLHHTMMDTRQDKALEKAKYLVENATADIFAVNKMGNSLLHLASGYGNFQAVQYFVEKGLNLNGQNKLGLTPLHYAALVEDDYDSVTIVRFLLERGADVGLKDYLGYAPPDFAITCARLGGFVVTLKNLYEQKRNATKV